MIPTTHKRELTLGSRTISIETGKLAKQADGAVIVRPGDTMVIQTKKGFYVYQVDRYQIVPPTSVDVIAAVPEQSGAKPTQKWFTLTTCDPKYGNANRYVVFSKFLKFYKPGALPEDVLADPNGKG